MFKGNINPLDDEAKLKQNLHVCQTNFGLYYVLRIKTATNVKAAPTSNFLGKGLGAYRSQDNRYNKFRGFDID